ncbi:chemotaxis protein CheW [Elioraea tepida]|jgi:purine-binding chemotaxis protein CheW|uniref:Chemotaxis protein CheW n=1 Tax=Elioraea tepida TaxID=2843330 RepID=A0A975U3F7_9PROT|nr:chemotaxis protein CheW [Elioraea tepida]QXM25272.1 chemotaxis protein CheW [Elioraea tepida]
MTTVIEKRRPARASSASEEFVTLTVGGQLCGIPVLTVRDILGPQSVTRVPLAPPEVAGSLNLRGRIVTAIDLRRRLGLSPAGEGARAMSVVVEVSGEFYSLLVDQVGEVLSLDGETREANPPTLDPRWRSVSSGVFRLQDKLMVVLDVERVLDFGAGG